MTPHRHALLAAALCFTLSTVQRAHALDEELESATSEAISQARTDYRDADYERGKASLEEALRACDPDKCSPGLHGAALLELGALEFKLGNEEAVPPLFTRAHALAPDLPFTHHDEPRLLAIWNRTKAGPGDRPAVRSDDPDDRKIPADVPRPRGWSRIWLGFAGTLDLVLMPSGSDLCKLSATGAPANELGIYCTNPDGSDFPSRTDPAQNNALVPGDSGEIEGGLTAGNLRVLFAADYAPLQTLLIGARLGYAFSTYSGRAADKGFPWLDRNLHAELRATYIFGREPLTHIGFAPIAFLAAGASEFDAQLTRYVTVSGSGRRPVNIWIVRGPWFVAAGAGTRYQFSPRIAFNAALRINAVLGEPSVLLTAGPDIGVSYGF